MGDAAAVASASGALLREAVAPAADRADEGAEPPVNGAGRSLVSRFIGNGPGGPSALVLAGLLAGGGAGSMLGGGPTMADLDAVKADLVVVKAAQVAVTAAQSAAQIELLEKQLETAQDQVGVAYWQGDNMRKLASAISVLAGAANVEVDTSISQLTRDR